MPDPEAVLKAAQEAIVTWELLGDNHALRKHSRAVLLDLHDRMMVRLQEAVHDSGTL